MHGCVEKQQSGRHREKKSNRDGQCWRQAGMGKKKSCNEAAAEGSGSDKTAIAIPEKSKKRVEMPTWGHVEHT